MIKGLKATLKSLGDFNKDLRPPGVTHWCYGLIMAGTVYPLWTLIVMHMTPELYDENRWIFGLLCLILSVVFLKLPKKSYLSRKFHLIGFLMVMSITTHYWYLIYRNSYHPVFAVGLFALIISATIVFSHIYQAAISLIVHILMGSFIAYHGMKWMIPSQYMFLILTIALFSFAASFMKISLINKLSASLEEEKASKEKLLASAKMASLGEMSAGIGHEINNPLMVMSNAVETMRMIGVSADNEPELEAIEKQITRVAKITKSLKLFATGAASPKADVDVNDVISTALALVNVRVHDNQIDLKYKANSDPTLVSICESEISQILINLVNNAIDEVTPLETKKLLIVREEDAKHVYIKVKDSGKGVPEHIRKDIFNPFFTTKEHGKGTGLGLSISKQLAQRNGGDLFIDEKSKGGACFVLKIQKAS